MSSLTPHQPIASSASLSVAATSRRRLSNRAAEARAKPRVCGWPLARASASVSSRRKSSVSGAGERRRSRGVAAPAGRRQAASGPAPPGRRSACGCGVKALSEPRSSSCSSRHTAGRARPRTNRYMGSRELYDGAAHVSILREKEHGGAGRSCHAGARPQRLSAPEGAMSVHHGLASGQCSRLRPIPGATTRIGPRRQENRRFVASGSVPMYNRPFSSAVWRTAQKATRAARGCLLAAIRRM